MFKSKKWLILLIPLTLIIWGIISYQIYDGLNPELLPIEPVDQARFRESETKPTSLIPLEKPEYDPFLGKRYVEKKTVIAPKNKNVIKKTILKWPKINYLGYIKDKNSSKKVAAVQINGSIRTFKPKQEIDSVQMLNATDRYVELRYKNVKKRFDKN